MESEYNRKPAPKTTRTLQNHNRAATASVSILTNNNLSSDQDHNTINKKREQ